MARIKELLRVIRLLRRGVYSELPTQQLEILCEVHQKDGITLHELHQLTGMPVGSLSRNVRMLGLFTLQPGGPLQGHGLVEAKQDLYHRKRVALWMTPKAQQIFKDIETLLQGKTEIISKIDVERMLP